MKKIIVSLLILTGLSTLKANAQMAAAQNIKWDITKEAEIDMDQETIWAILGEPELIGKASNGYVRTIAETDENSTASRKIIFANGDIRLEKIVQHDKENNFMVIHFAPASLPKGVTSAEISIFSKAKGDKCNIALKAVVKGDSEAKKALIAKLTTEFENYIAGLKNIAENSVPATTME
uniref:hypothetical protein n=1 Tax=Pedobacter schmidteae TaxID=2201271 RepID=UPI000EAD2C6C|nr:hypothetical protein [Pedobacter schmidteae]